VVELVKGIGRGVESRCDSLLSSKREEIFPLNTLDFPPPGETKKSFVSALSLSLFCFSTMISLSLSFLSTLVRLSMFLFVFCVLFSSLANPSFSFLDLNYCLEEFDDKETESSRVVHGTNEDKENPTV